MADGVQDKILAALASIGVAGRSESARDLVSSLQVANGEAVVALEVDHAMGPAMEDLRRDAEDAVRKIPGVISALVVLTAERKAPPASQDPHGMEKNPKLVLPFRHVIAVASGKGGVGKSTVAFNLAVAMAEKGLGVALLDADIYGPSVPRLAGLVGKKPVTDPAGRIVPMEAHGLRLMSMGFLVEEEKPMIWRGPMIQTAFYQMLRDVAWQNENSRCDVLIIDMPPGTGDVQLTLAQKVPVTGAVIVSTPQDLALIDARKAIVMFEKTGVKILGLIENMSYYHCPNCDHRDDIFGHGGARSEAQRQGVAFLGEIPLNGAIRAAADNGEPTRHVAYRAIAQILIHRLEERDLRTDTAGSA